MKTYMNTAGGVRVGSDVSGGDERWLFVALGAAVAMYVQLAPYPARVERFSCGHKWEMHLNARLLPHCTHSCFILTKPEWKGSHLWVLKKRRIRLKTPLEI